MNQFEGTQDDSPNLLSEYGDKITETLALEFTSLMDELFNDGRTAKQVFETFESEKEALIKQIGERLSLAGNKIEALTMDVSTIDGSDIADVTYALVVSPEAGIKAGEGLAAVMQSNEYHVRNDITSFESGLVDDVRRLMEMVRDSLPADRQVVDYAGFSKVLEQEVSKSGLDAEYIFSPSASRTSETGPYNFSVTAQNQSRESSVEGYKGKPVVYRHTVSL